MSGTRALKTKRRKLDSIISKLKVHPSQEAVDLPNESLKPKNQESEKDNEKDNESRTNLDSVKKKSKRKSKVIVRYRINDDDDEEDDNDDIEVTEDTTCAIPTETSQDKDEIEEVEEEAPLKDSQLPETIFEELPNGDAMSFDGENTTVLFLPAEDIQVQTGPSDDYLGDLLDGADDSNHEEQEEEEEKGKGKKKKKKKSKTYESDESLDEDGLPRRVMCTACGRKVNPSHGTILRHPVLNVLVCKKCNQYYNSGPFTRDEYGIEEQCRWCGDGGDLICCDDCEKVYCKPCLQRNCGKTYLKNLINAPEDFKWLCIACEKEKPPKHIQRLRKKCDQVMQTLDNIKAQKAHFKSKKGQQPSVVNGPTTSERRSRLNCLSEGIKAEGFSSSGESPTKKCFGADLPAELFSKVDDENQEDQTEIELNEKDASKEDEETGEEKEESEHDSQDPGSESKLPNERDADGETKESETKIQEMDTESSGEVLRTSLRSRSKDKESKDNKTSNKVEEKEKEDDEQEEEEEEEEEGEVQGSSEKIPKRKTRSQHRQESKEEEENDSDAKSTSDDDTATISKEKKVLKSKKTQDEELSSMETESPELEDETSSPEENVRATRSGKRQIAKTRTRAGSKDTPQQSEEDENVKNSDKRRKKVKTVVNKVKQENASDEQDSSDSTSGKRLSRTSKDKANKLIIKKENTKVNKKQESKTVIVIDLDDESEDKEDENTEEQSKAKKLEKGKDSQSSKGKKKTVDTSVKKEKSSDSSDSNSKLTRSKRKGKTPVSLEKGKKDSKKDSKKISESESDDSDTNISPKRTKRNQKRQAELSSDSDFQKGKSSKKAATNKKQNKLEQSSDSDVMDTPEKDKPENSDFSLEESSESDEKSSDSESDVQPTSSRSRGLQKQTRKRPRPVESDSESQPSSEESSDNSGVAKRTRKKKQIESDTSDDGAKKRKSVVKNKREKKTVKKGRKLRKRKGAPESEESEASDKEESSDSEPEKKTKKGKQKKKQKGKKPAKKKTRRRVKDNSNDESSDDETEEKSPTKGRKKIRKLLTDEKLNEETKKARRLEEERRNRLLERTRTAEEEEAKPESSVLSTIVLEKDKETKEPLVEVESDLVQHLKPHQSKGIQFMYDNIVDSLESYKKGDKGGGCILAHCMGLGKTLQVVSLIHTLHNHKEFEFRTTLIIAPLNTVLNWQVEFDKWLSVDERMEVYVLKEAGHNNWHRADMLKQWQRYGGIMIIGYDSYRNLSQCQRIRSKHQKKIFKESLVDPGPDIVVCDEGHILRNDQSAVSKAINSIRTRRRIALTGTPLQNNLVEYHCMVSFVKPNLLGTRKEFMNLFGNPIMNGQCNDSSPMDVKIMKQSSHVLYKLLEACVQRRDYSVLTPFLPPKHEYVVKIRLSETQRKLYSHYLSTFVFPEGGAMSGRGPSLFSDYQCLSRIWTHPWCLKLEAIRRSLRAPYSDSDNSLDGFVVHTDEESESEPSSDEMSIKSDNSTPKKPKNKKNGEVFELKSSSEEGESANDNNSDEEVLPQKSSRLTRSTAPIVDKVTVAEDNKKGLNGDVDSFESSTRSGNNFKEDMPEEKEWYDEFIGSEDEYNVELSGKLALLLEILADAEAVEEKVLVFSQSLVTLDLIERALGGGEVGGDRENWCRGCDYFRMDGSTNVQYRQRWSDIFNDVDNKTARLFLISTKAGGLGINLVAANRVVVFDVSWNPSHDVQSIFRVFRFGQTKPVYVYRLVSEGTMEERIYDRQIAKLSTSQRVIDKHQIERHFTAADLSELYRFNPSTYDEEKDKDSVPSLPLPKDAVLADLINRMHPKWIVKYHEHDSLLQNVEAEQLNEDEMKQAWAAYEAQKNQASQNFNARALQAQYAQQQLQQQRQAVPSQNMNYSNSVLQQMQQYQRQQLARIQAQSAMQRQYLPALPADQQLHSEQLRQQLLQHLGANRPVYQAPAGTTYQQMMSYLQQQPPANRIIRLPSTPQQQPNPTQPNPTQPNNIVLGRGQPTYRM